MNRLQRVGVALSGTLVPRLVAAQEDEAVEQIEVVVKMVRWEGIVASIVLVFAAWVALRLMDTVFDALGRGFAERRLLLQRISAFLRFGVYFAVIVSVVFLSFHVNRQVLVLLGGTLAVATGFALRDAAASVVSGVLIMFDRPFQLGDRVRFGGEYGDVTAMGLRSVKLRTLDDSIVTIPNNRFMTDVTVCGNYGVLDMQLEVDFHIGVEQDVELARSLVREAAVISSYVHLPKPVEVLVSEVTIGNAVGLLLKLRAYVLDTRYEGRFVTDVTLRVREAFSKHHIHPPAVLHRSSRGGEEAPS